jgi:hypothetical protein
MARRMFSFLVAAFAVFVVANLLAVVSEPDSPPGGPEWHAEGSRPIGSMIQKTGDDVELPKASTPVIWTSLTEEWISPDTVDI